MQKSVRVRFAPSPTGYLHIGGVRTALFNYLFAKGHDGQFILRIEDTDTERSNAVYTEDILKSLQWLGLNWDEGPIFQSQRFERYREACYQLVEKGHAYFCYCTPEEIEVERKRLEAEGKKPMYAGKCRDLPIHNGKPNPNSGPAVIRFKTPRSEGTSFQDVIRGQITFQNIEMDDFVLLRGNGSPTYNLACVVDDYDGRMTHIIRGDDHINNTPKQVLIFKALGYEPPQFVHLPMILGADKKKLSKRHGAVSANQYRADGFLPQAVINYLARLGWAHGDQEVFSKEELIKLFGLEKIGKSNAVFNTEKLLWLNGHYIRESTDEKLAKILLEDFADEFNAWGRVPSLREKLTSPNGLGLIGLAKQKVRTLKELAALLRPLIWDGEIPLDENTYAQWPRARLTGPFDHILSELEHVTKDGQKSEGALLLDLGADAKTLETLYRGTADRFGMKLVELAQPTRFFIQGATAGPQLFDVISRMPWAVVKRRLQRYSAVLK